MLMNVDQQELSSIIKGLQHDIATFGKQFSFVRSAQ